MLEAIHFGMAFAGLALLGFISAGLVDIKTALEEANSYLRELPTTTDLHDLK